MDNPEPPAGQDVARGQAAHGARASRRAQRSRFKLQVVNAAIKKARRPQSASTTTSTGSASAPKYSRPPSYAFSHMRAPSDAGYTRAERVLPSPARTAQAARRCVTRACFQAARQSAMSRARQSRTSVQDVQALPGPQLTPYHLAHAARRRYPTCPGPPARPRSTFGSPAGSPRASAARRQSRKALPKGSAPSSGQPTPAGGSTPSSAHPGRASGMSFGSSAESSLLPTARVPTRGSLASAASMDITAALGGASPSSLLALAPTARAIRRAV